MSKRYIGGFISTSPPTAYTNSVTPGVWTLEEQIQKVYGNNWQFYPPGGFFQADVLLVGGGGGGGSFTASATAYFGGGGGGGGVVYISGLQSLTTNTYTVSVGSGGAAGPTSLPGSNGGNSTITGYFYLVGNYSLTAKGGGGGGSSVTNNASSGGANGGGGGAYMTFASPNYTMANYSGQTGSQIGTNSTTSFPTLIEYGSNSGATAGRYSTTATSINAYIYSGAGGGATSGPLNNQFLATGISVAPIQGGTGFSSTIAGTLTYYGTGASSVAFKVNGIVTTVGVPSANGSSLGSVGTYGSGAGGCGGAYNGSVQYLAQSGQPGTVIIKYLQTTANITFTGATVTQSSPYTIAQYYANGSFTINEIFPYMNPQF